MMNDNTLLNAETQKVKQDIENKEMKGEFDIFVGPDNIPSIALTLGAKYTKDNVMRISNLLSEKIKEKSANEPLNLNTIKLANDTLTGGAVKDLTQSYYSLPIDMTTIAPEPMDASEIDIRNVDTMSASQVAKRVWKEQTEVADLNAALGYQAAIGKISDNNMLNISNEAIIKFNQENGILRDYDLLQNPIKVIAGETARQSNIMLGLLKSGLKSGLEAAPIGAGIALAAGQAGPQVLTAEEVFTVPAASVAAFSVGMAYGGASYIFKLETGSMYRDLIAGGVPKNIAQPVSFVTGALNTFIETAGIAAILGGHPEGYLAAKAVKTLGSSLTKKTLAIAAKAYLTNNGIEVAQEVVQTLVDGVVKYATQTIMDSPGKLIDKKQFMQNLKDAVMMTVAGGGVLSSIGTGIETARFQREVNKNINKIRGAEKLKAKGEQKEVLSPEERERKNKFQEEVLGDILAQDLKLKKEQETKNISDIKEKILQNVLTPERFKTQQEYKAAKIPSFVWDAQKQKPIKSFFDKVAGVDLGFSGLWKVQMELLNAKGLFKNGLDPLNVEDTERQYAKTVIEQEDIYTNHLKDEYKKLGLSEKDMLVKTAEDHKKSVTGKYIYEKDGVKIEKEIEWTPAEARSFYMLSQDPDTRARLKQGGYTFEEDFKSDPTAITTETIVKKSLTDEDYAIIEATKKFFEDQYEIIDEVYQEREGKPAPYRKNYFARASVIDEGADIVKINREGDLNVDVTPASLQKRAIGLKDATVKIVSDRDVINNSIRSTSHWIAWQEKLNLLNDVFKDTEIKKSIEEKYGTYFYDSIKNQIASFAEGERKLYKDLADKMIGKYFVSKFSTAQLAFKPMQFAKQMSSAIQYLPYYKNKDMFITGLVNFASDPKTAIETIMEVPDVRLRLQMGMTKEIAVINEIQKTLATKDLRSLGMLFTKYGDLASIFVGGWGLYLDELQKTGDHTKAIDKLIKATNEIQQSPNISQMTNLQKSSNPFWQLSSNFIQGNNQVLNKLKFDIIKAGRSGSVEDMEKVLWSILTFSVLAPALRLAVSLGGKIKSSDLYSAMATNVTDGYNMIGSIFNWAVNTVLTDSKYELTTLKGFDYFLKTFEKATKKIASDIKKGKVGVKSLEGVGDLLGMGGDIATGLPVSRGIDIGKEVSKEKYEKAGLMAVGFPKSAASRLTGEKEKKSRKRKRDF